MELSEFLHYKALDERLEEYIQRLQLKTSDNWLPFHFEYADRLYGLRFKPLDLEWRRLDTEEDLFTLFFDLSIVSWLYRNGVGTSESELGLELFGIPNDFSTQSLQLSYQNRCSDPLARIIYFLPLKLLDIQLGNYNEEELSLLLDWFGFDEPIDDILPFLQGRKIWINGSDVIIQQFDIPQLPHDPMNGVFAPQFTHEELLRHYLRYALQALRANESEDIPLDFQPATFVSDRYGKRKSEQLTDPWFIAQTRILLLFLDSIGKYVNYSYRSVNERCRDGSITTLASRLLRAFSLVPPTPREFIVNRVVGTGANMITGITLTETPLDTEITELAFMSTSTLDRLKEVTSESNPDYIYLTLTIPIGARLLNLSHTGPSHEVELLLPPGTRYILTSREVHANGLVAYRGRVLR